MGSKISALRQMEKFLGSKANIFQQTFAYFYTSIYFRFLLDSLMLSKVTQMLLMVRFIPHARAKIAQFSYY